MNNKNLSLVLNASEGILQIVVGDDENLVLAHQEWDCPQNGTEKLTPYIKDIFKKLERNLEDISRIACVTGAGSFTGIRLTLCTSSALSRVVDSKQVSIDFLHALSFNAFCKKNTQIRVITHAKKNLVHCADFIVDENSYPQQKGATNLIDPLDALTFENSFDNSIPIFLLGSGVKKLNQEIIEKLESNIFILPESANIINPRVLLFLANSLEASEKDLNPEYVRACDAVDNLEHISKKLGNNSEEAFKLYSNIIK